MQPRFDTLWAIAPDAAHAVLQLISRSLGLPGADSTSMLAHSGAKPSMQGRGNDKMAVIPIHGVLTNDGPAYYGSRYPEIAEAVEKAASDPDVKRIILSVDFTRW